MLKMLIEKKSGIFVVKSEEQNDNVDGYFNNK